MSVQHERFQYPKQRIQEPKSTTEMMSAGALGQSEIDVDVQLSSKKLKYAYALNLSQLLAHLKIVGLSSPSVPLKIDTQPLLALSLSLLKKSVSYKPFLALGKPVGTNVGDLEKVDRRSFKQKFEKCILDLRSRDVVSFE